MKKRVSGSGQLTLFPEEPKKQIEKTVASGLDEYLLACQDLGKGDAFLQAVRFIAKFSSYSPLNAFLIYAQKPSALFVATPSKWRLRFGREVRSGARPIIILAPRSPVVFLYDVSDTEGPEPLSAIRKTEEKPRKGNLYLWVNTVKNCIEWGRIEVMYTENAVSTRSRALNGTRQIEISRNLVAEEERYASLVHELTHIYLGHLGSGSEKLWPDRTHLTENQREIEAETVTHLVCERAGVKTVVLERIAHRLMSGEDDLTKISLREILEVATLIENMGKGRLPVRKEKKAGPAIA